MPRPTLISTDLDGTVVRSDDTVSAYTREVFARVRAAGIPVVGATGRGPRLLELTRNNLPAAGYLVLAGGARVVKVADPPVTLVDVKLDGPSVAAMLDELELATGPLTVMVETLEEADAPLRGELHPSWPWPQRVEEMPWARALETDVIKVFVRTAGLEVDALLEVAREVIPPEKATATQSGQGYVEICPPGVDKATGLAVVADELGLDPGGVVVFGDMPNDLPMFAWAGRAVAVGNAHPSVAAAADEVTLSNDEDGVAVWLDRMLSQ